MEMEIAHYELSGKTFKYNEIICVNGINAPMRVWADEKRESEWLHPSKCNLETLKELNPNKTEKELKAVVVTEEEFRKICADSELSEDLLMSIYKR